MNALGCRVVEAIVAHDWMGIALCFEPEANFRAVMANDDRAFRDYEGGGGG